MTELSGNWKKLQQTFPGPSKDKSGSATLGTKRRRDAMTENLNEPRKRSKSVNIKRPGTVSLSKSISIHDLKHGRRSELENQADRQMDESELNIGEGVSTTHLPGRYIGLDCEMVGVGPIPDRDSQLARVSLVNWHGKQVYDAYVLPVLPVTDYRTPVSGIRAHHLRAETGAKPFDQVKSDVHTFLAGRILVGHYMRNDFLVLDLKHPRRDVRDTSTLVRYREMCQGGPKLKELAEKVLGLNIQSGEHNSVEDARAAMMLYKAAKDEMDADVDKRFGRVTQTKPKPSKRKGKRK
jgi:RNA exonuclease 4